MLVSINPPHDSNIRDLTGICRGWDIGIIRCWIKGSTKGKKCLHNLWNSSCGFFFWPLFLLQSFIIHLAYYIMNSFVSLIQAAVGYFVNSIRGWNIWVSIKKGNFCLFSTFLRRGSFVKQKNTYSPKNSYPELSVNGRGSIFKKATLFH